MVGQSCQILYDHRAGLRRTHFIVPKGKESSIFWCREWANDVQGFNKINDLLKLYPLESWFAKCDAGRPGSCYILVGGCWGWSQGDRNAAFSSLGCSGVQPPLPQPERLHYKGLTPLFTACLLRTRELQRDFISQLDFMHRQASGLCMRIESHLKCRREALMVYPPCVSLSNRTPGPMALIFMKLMLKTLPSVCCGHCHLHVWSQLQCVAVCVGSGGKSYSTEENLWGLSKRQASC